MTYNGLTPEKIWPNKQDSEEEIPTQSHVHELLGSTKFAESGDDKHNHRFATVSSEAIPLQGGSHKHAFFVKSDFYDHLHDVTGETGRAYHVGNGKHVHFATGQTTKDDGHYHDFQFATLIENPLLPVNV